LPGHESHRNELQCNRQLVKQGGSWEVQAVSATGL
jgi:ATP phosphoribosyltransferase regulatory subunit